MKLNEFQKNIFRSIGTRFACFALNLLLKTLRIEIINGDSLSKLVAEKKNFVVAFWHGSMLIGWFIHRNENIAALVSRSKDGNVLAEILKKWNYHVVRGSSHIGGKEALEIMLQQTGKNRSLAITPDGPTGPIYQMKAGAVITAKKSLIPLYLVGIGVKKKIILKSWDQFNIPKPFSRAVVIYSDPISIDHNLSYEETNKKIIECEELLNKLQKEALELC